MSQEMNLSTFLFVLNYEENISSCAFILYLFYLCNKK